MEFFLSQRDIISLAFFGTYEYKYVSIPEVGVTVQGFITLQAPCKTPILLDLRCSRVHVKYLFFQGVRKKSS